MSKKYGASIYASIRQYVIKHQYPCAVLVLDPPVLTEGTGFHCNLRRVLTSPSFQEAFGDIRWPQQFTPDDRIGSMVPAVGKRISGKRQIPLTDGRGEHRECLAEAFTQTHQVFILILLLHKPMAKSIIVPAHA